MKKDADTEYGESKDVAADRISKETAELVNIPPFTVEKRSVKFLLNQKKIYQNIERVPLNTKLLDSIEKDGLMNPILTMPNYYPIAGSQRMRALWSLVKGHPDGFMFKTITVEVHRFDKEWWNMFYLWSEKDFRDKAIAIWFQMVELAWKSKHYEYEKDTSGVAMTEFELLGDTLKWKHDKNNK